MLSYCASDQKSSARLEFARARLAAHRSMLLACELEVDDDARVQTMLGQLVLGDLARFDADEVKKRTHKQKISNITAGKLLVSKGGDNFFSKTDTKDVVATAMAIHEAVPCASGSDSRGRDQTWKRTIKTIRALWGGKLWDHITKLVLQAHRLDPYVLAKLKDQHPHAFNSTALDILHKAEGCEKGIAGLIPSSSTISRILKRIDQAYGLPDYFNITEARE